MPEWKKILVVIAVIVACVATVIVINQLGEEETSWDELLPTTNPFNPIVEVGSVDWDSVVSTNNPFAPFEVN